MDLPLVSEAEGLRQELLISLPVCECDSTDATAPEVVA